MAQTKPLHATASTPSHASAPQGGNVCQSEALTDPLIVPSFADYFDEYARMAVGIVGLGTLALGLLLWGAL